MSYKIKNGKMVRNAVTSKLAAKLTHLTDIGLLASDDPDVLAVLSRRVAQRKEMHETFDEMAKAGIVVDTGERRLGRDGQLAVVWELAPDADKRFRERYGRYPAVKTQ
jgi:hypothetical protein